MSIHTWNARQKAKAMGAYAGRDDAADLWDLSKRELIEIALRLAEIATDEGGAVNAIARAKQEHAILRQNGII